MEASPCASQEFTEQLQTIFVSRMVFGQLPDKSVATLQPIAKERFKLEVAQQFIKFSAICPSPPSGQTWIAFLGQWVAEICSAGFKTWLGSKLGWVQNLNPSFDLDTSNCRSSFLGNTQPTTRPIIDRLKAEAHQHLTKLDGKM
jgi:hypothetical protein